VHWQGAVPHTADGLADLLARLRRFRRRGSLRVALERPSGLLVDTLLDAGLEVVPIHPNALKASRPRYSAAGAKSDPGDAFILADLLRTDGHRFRPLHPPSDDTRALRALVRGRDDLVAQRSALANQLRALLEPFWPGPAPSTTSPPPWPPRWLSIPMARSCRACPAAALSTRRRSWPSSGMLPHRRTVRGRGRLGARHACLRPAPRRRVSLGVQQAPAPCRHDLRR